VRSPTRFYWESFHSYSTPARCCGHSSRLRLVAVCTFDDVLQIRLADQPASSVFCNSTIDTPTDVREFLRGSEFQFFLRDRIVDWSCSNSNKVCANPNSAKAVGSAKKCCAEFNVEAKQDWTAWHQCTKNDCECRHRRDGPREPSPCSPT
jgi:hypothetical protein